MTITIRALPAPEGRVETYVTRTDDLNEAIDRAGRRFTGNRRAFFQRATFRPGVYGQFFAHYDREDPAASSLTGRVRIDIEE